MTAGEAVRHVQDIMRPVVDGDPRLRDDQPPPDADVLDRRIHGTEPDATAVLYASTALMLRDMDRPRGAKMLICSLADMAIGYRFAEIDKARAEHPLAVLQWCWWPLTVAATAELGAAPDDHGVGAFLIGDGRVGIAVAIDPRHDIRVQAFGYGQLVVVHPYHPRHRVR